jgi:hypothetical protein
MYWGGEGDGNAERALNKWFWHDSIPNFHAGYLYTAKYALLGVRVYA